MDQGIDLNGSQYLDLSANVKQLSALDSGSISFWLKASGNSDMTILSGSFADINNSFYRLFLRDNGTIRQEAMAEGQELCKVTSDASVNLGDNKWHHAVVVIGANGSTYHIDGIGSGSPWARQRTGLSDRHRQANHLVAYHRTSDSMHQLFQWSVGRVPDYDRSLAGGIYLYDLAFGGREQFTRSLPLSVPSAP